MSTCTQCNAAASADDQFCRECGAALLHATVPTTSDVARIMRAAKRAHKKQQWDEAREGYISVIRAGTNPKLSGRAQRALKAVEAGRVPTGKLGYWALGLVVAPAALMWLAMFLPSRIEVALSVILLSLMSVGGVLGAACAAIALLGQRGGWNKLAGIVAIAIVATVLTKTGRMDQEKEQRFLIVQGASAAAPYRMAVAEAYHESGQFPNSQQEAPLAPTAPEQAEMVDAITITTGGVVTIQFALGPAAGKTIIYRPTADENNQITWTCHEGTVPRALRPPSCRQAQR